MPEPSKFLDTEAQKQVGLGTRKKATLLTHQHIIKGSSARLPFVTANEHLCMQVTARVVESAKTELSEGGNVLLVHRFDVDENGKPFRAMEDFCALLGLRPQNKYETTWERIAKAVRTYVDGKYHYKTFQKLTAMLLMTYALRNLFWLGVPEDCVGIFRERLLGHGFAENLLEGTQQGANPGG
jgi:serine/threonine-protein kinase HipA